MRRFKTFLIGLLLFILNLIAQYNSIKSSAQHANNSTNQTQLIAYNQEVVCVKCKNNLHCLT